MQRVLTELGLLVREARREGAAGVEILTEEWNGHRLDVERGRVMHHTPVSGTATQIRVWLDGGKQGRVRIEGDCDRSALVNQALQLAQDAEAVPLSGPQGRLTGLLGGLGIDDRRYGQVEEADRGDVALAAERAGSTSSSERITQDPEDEACASASARRGRRPRHQAFSSADAPSFRTSTQ